MKIIKIFMAATALAAGCLASMAQEDLTVVLKNGTELTGYISRQRPGNDFTFTTSKASVILPSKDVKSIVDNDLKLSTLSPEWQKWAEENNAIRGTGDSRSLVLSDILTEKGSVNRVRILEKGAKVRYLQLSPASYTLSWDTIAVVKAEKRPTLLLSGVNRRYQLASGMQYEGQYIEEVPGETLSLLCDNGLIQVFETEDVVKDSRVKLNPNQSLMEQSDLLDIVNLKNGGSYRGVIVERHYSEKGKAGNDFLLIQLENGNTESVALKDVREYLKEKNSGYKPVTDIELKEGEGAVSRNIAKLRPTKEIKGMVTVNADSLEIVLPRLNPQDITVEMQVDNTRAQQLKLLHLKQYEDKKTKIRFYGFTFEDMVKHAVTPKSVETSVNGVSRLEYTFPAGTSGVYGVYDPLSNKILIFRILGPDKNG